MKLIIPLILCFLLSCSESRKSDKEITVSASNFPTSWSVDFISGNSVKNLYLVPEDIDPAYWQPTDPDLQKLNEFDLVITNGATYEKWLNKVSLNNTFNSSKNLKEKFITIKDAVVHEHNGEKHSHDGTDFNTWLDFDLFLLQAQNIKDKLKELIPNSEVNFDANLKALSSEITELKNEFAKVTEKEKTFYASHPVYNYFGRQYGLDIKNFHWEPEEMPSDEEWQKLESMKAHSKYMLWEDEPIEEIKKKLISMGIKVIVFRTCGNKPPTGDFIKEMKNNLANFREILQPK